jgi:hypothetical protein
MQIRHALRDDTVNELHGTERRRYGRVRPVQRLRGTVGQIPVYVVDISMNGVRVAHQEPIPPGAAPVMLRFEWDGRAVTLQCQVRRTRVERVAKSQFDKGLIHSGLAIVTILPASREALRDLIASCVTRALDEQVANARGIPAIAAQSFQTGRQGDEFLRCELINGNWRRLKTRVPEQPSHGFTVSADEDESKVDMLCRAYETGDADGRKLIRTFAALSISKTEGIPTRRYEP